MKTCPNCQQQMDDNLAFCMNCGTQLPAGQPVPAPQPVPTPPPVAPITPPPTAQFNNQAPPQYGSYGNVPPVQPAPVFDPFDHTAEFTAKDISEHKLLCMLLYLLGVFGIIIALLMAKDSPYVDFHIKQEIKIAIIDILITVALTALIWTIIVPLACVILLAILLVVKIICFAYVCGGKAIEAPIIRHIIP